MLVYFLLLRRVAPRRRAGLWFSPRIPSGRGPGYTRVQCRIDQVSRHELWLTDALRAQGVEPAQAECLLRLHLC